MLFNHAQQIFCRFIACAYHVLNLYIKKFTTRCTITIRCTKMKNELDFLNISICVVFWERIKH